MNQLQKQGLSLASRCPLCKEAEEEIEHLLILAQRFGTCGQPSSTWQEGAGFASFQLRICF